MEWTESDYSRDTAIRFARAGALLSIVCADDACTVCKARAGVVCLPSDAPRLPIRGCLHESCRCHFVAVDPKSRLTVPQLVDRGIEAIKVKQLDLARSLLHQAVALDEMDERGWLWLSAVVGDEQKVACLENVLAINPQNARARAGLEALRKKLVPGVPSVAEVEVRVEPSPPGSAAQEPSPAAQKPAPVPVAVPPEVAQVREERKIILEQWTNFIEIAAEMSPDILQVQGRAFLNKIQDLGEQALAGLSPKMQRDELAALGQEAEDMAEALGNLALACFDYSSAGRAIQYVIRDLARDVLDYRSELQKRAQAIKG